MSYKNVICLVIGLIVGVRLTDFWDYVKLQQPQQAQQQQLPSITTPHNNSNNSLSPAITLIETLSAFTHQPLHDAGWHQTLPGYLYNKTRVLCWVLTTPQYHLKRAIHVKNTWGRRCNKLLFMSTQPDSHLGTVVLPVKEGRAFLWEKTRAAFKYVYDHYFDEADWFLKADDDTYFIMENLRAFLYQFSWEAPVYFGCKFHPFVKQGYMSGGAGYVLSKAALRRFAEVAYANKTLCAQNKLSEDKELGICLQNAGVAAGDSRDEEGAERFMPLAPMHLIPAITSEWYTPYLFYKRDKNLKCCSRSAISFHYIKPKDFYILDYLLYRLRPFGVEYGPMKLPTKVNATPLLQKWRHELSDNIFKDDN